MLARYRGIGATSSCVRECSHAALTHKDQARQANGNVRKGEADNRNGDSQAICAMPKPTVHRWLLS